jgi:hypothetical protein
VSDKDWADRPAADRAARAAKVRRAGRMDLFIGISSGPWYSTLAFFSTTAA